MKKLFLIPLLAASLVCSGCDFSFEAILGINTSHEKENEKDDEEKEPEVDPGEDPTDDPLEPLNEGAIEGFIIKDEFIKVKKESTSDTPLVDIYFAEGYDWDSADVTLEWSVGDETIASVDFAGRITGLKKGKTTLTLRIDICNTFSTIPVFVYENESDIQKSWKKIGEGDEINEKDTLIIACPQEGKAATDDDAGHKLGSCDVTFNANKSEITNAGSAAQFFVYSDYKGRGGLTFELPEREGGSFLGATNTANVSFFDTPKSDQTVWDVEFDSSQGVWDMRPSTNVDGWMMYNKDLGKFANYQSNETAFMFVITLYRLTYTLNV